jgi:hypothetical protein
MQDNAMTTQSTIFHAFNMRYSAIRDIVPRLVELGISHIQFPPIQKTRTFSEYDGELLRNQVHAYEKRLAQFHELCLKAQEKSMKYKGNVFDHILRSHIYYINQPTLRLMYNALVDGMSYSELIQHTINEIRIKGSQIAKAFVEIGFVGKKHRWYNLFQIAEMILVYRIDPLLYKEDTMKQIETDIEILQVNLKIYDQQISEYKKNKQIPDDSLLTKHKTNKIKIAKLHTIKKNLVQSKRLQELLQKTSKILQEIQSEQFAPLHGTFDSVHVAQILNCIHFYELIVYPLWWLIYQPVQLAIGDTFLGTRDEIQEAISVCNKHGIRVIIDIVVNNLAAIAGERAEWASIANYEGDWKTHPHQAPILRLKQFLRDAFGSDDLDIVTAPRDCKWGQEPTHCWMSLALPQLNQMHRLVQSKQNEFLKSLADLGVDGVRIDAAAHLSPEHCERIIQTFNSYNSNSGVSYIEYLGGFESWRKYTFTDYHSRLRLEDFDIGESIYTEIFGAHAQLQRTKNYANTSLKRYTNLDSVVMLLNHDHLMGSIPSKIFTDLPSKTTYDLALAYLLQRIYGHVLIMPHDISSQIVIRAIDLRKQMRNLHIVREYVDIYNNSVMISCKFDIHDDCLFISAFNLHNESQPIMYGVLEAHSFQWIVNTNQFILSDISNVYNRTRNTIMKKCYTLSTRKITKKTYTRRRPYPGKSIEMNSKT